MHQLLKKRKTSSFTELYENLNAEQKLAVDTVEGPVMVIAGPGTGKTQILAMRIANILQNPDLQALASNILCLTFSESAATNMRQRLISIIGSDAYQVRIHTFHSFCNEIIKDNPHKFFAINPISELEQIQIFDEIIDGLDASSPIKPFGDPYIYRGDLINSIKTLKRESVSVTELEKAIDDCHEFIEKNSLEIEDFISRHARTIKEDDCSLFIEKLHVKNPESQFVSMIQDYYDKSEKIAAFKKLVKDFYDKNKKEIPKQRELALVYQEYIEKLKSKKLYDFEDMILRVINQLANDKELLLEYQEQFQYILVDEYQDTNGAQNKLIGLLTSYYQEKANIFVVGDDDQSVYRFQGASLENIIYFYRRYQDELSLVVLGKNYRSQQSILDTASQLINSNSSRISNLVQTISKNLESSGAASNYDLEKVEIAKASNIKEEIFYIAQKIQNFIASGVSASEIAVLYRNNKEAELLMDIFARMKLPARLEVGEDILQDRLICQLLDLVKIIEKPEANSALLFNLLNYDFIAKAFGFSARDIYFVNQKRKEKRDKDDKKPFLDYLLDDPKFKDLADRILSLNQISYNQRLDIVLEAIIKDFGYLDYVLNLPDYFIHVANLDSLFAEIKSLIDSPLKKYKETTSKTLRLSDLVEHIELLQANRLQIKAKSFAAEANSIKLMTAHKSKGLEYDYVFIHGCNDKRWTNKRSMSKLKLPPFLIKETEALLAEDKDEDDRRLFFVALTRAKKKAFVFYHAKNDKGQELVPAIFIDEINSLSERLDLTQEDEPNELAKLKLSFAEPEIDDFAYEKEYIDKLLENYKLSITHLNNYLDCPRKFFYQNLLKVPSAKSKHASFGTAVHNALYDFFSSLHHGKEKAEQAIEFLLESFKKHLVFENLPEQEYEDSLSYGQEILTDYFNNYKKSFHPNNLLEYDFSSKGLVVEGVEITGKLDKIEIKEDNSVNVVDYKTGNPSSRSKDLKAGGHYHRQIVFYQLLCDEALKTGQFKYKMTSGEIDFIQTNSKQEFVKEKIIVEAKDQDELQALIKDCHSKIKEHNFDKTEELDTCKTCFFKNVCAR